MSYFRSKRKYLKTAIWLLVIGFLLINIMAIFHSYKFTHFAGGEIKRTKDPSKLSPQEKFATLVFGVSNPRPRNEVYPSQAYETVKLKSNKLIEGWHIKTPASKGTVIIFHGFSAQKSSMLDKAEVFRNLGYSTLLIDFMGSGGI